MQAKLLRVLGENRFCVMLCQTGAITSIQCDVGDARTLMELSKSSAARPQDVEVTLGEYSIDKAMFCGCTMACSVDLSECKGVTKYKRISV